MSGVVGFTSNQVAALSPTQFAALTTTQLADGRVLYLIGVAPQNEASVYENAFQRIRQSIQLSDR